MTGHTPRHRPFPGSRWPLDALHAAAADGRTGDYLALMPVIPPDAAGPARYAEATNGPDPSTIPADPTI